MAALGLHEVTYAPGILKGGKAPDEWGRAATLNRILRRLYPDENYGEGETVASTGSKFELRMADIEQSIVSAR